MAETIFRLICCLCQLRFTGRRVSVDVIDKIQYDG